MVPENGYLMRWDKKISPQRRKGAEELYMVKKDRNWNYIRRHKKVDRIT